MPRILLQRLLPILLLWGFSSLAFGATITANSCSQSDVQTAVTSAATGDTVAVPSGSCSWSSAVVVPNTKGITLQCASGTCTIAQGSSSGYLQVNQNASTGSRVTGFNFTGAGSSSNCDVASIGSPSSAAARIDHNVFTNAAGSEFICTSGNAPVLIDHNTLTGGAASEMIHNLGLGASDASGWTNDVTPGSSGMVFIEDNTFTFAATSAFFGTSAVQSYYGARTVFRHNVLNNAQVDQHGTPGNIGARWWEIYANTFCTYPGINQSNYGDLRAGSGVFYDNTVPTTAPCGANSGGGFVTLHEEDSGYPALYQIGRGISQNLSPAYLWNNASGITVNSGSANVQLNRDYFTSGSQPGSLVRWELSADNGSTTYSYTPYTYPHPLQGTTYFVANAGSDGAAGTFAAPWKTIAKVNGFSFASGDVISFKRGDTWNEATDAALTVPASNTTYTAYGSGALPILDGQGTVAQGFTASSKSNVVVDSLNIKRNTSYNALFASCDTCSITNSTLADAGVHSVNVTSASPTFAATGNTYSTSSTFHMTGKVFNIASTSAAVSTISSNTIDVSQVLNTDNVSGIVCSASVTACVVTNNVITMAQGVQGIGIKTVSASGHTTGGQITGNSIVGLTNACTGCDGEAIELTGADGTHRVQTTTVSGNYVKNGSASADCIGLFWTDSNVVSYNMCIGNSGQNAAIHVTQNSTNNFFYGNDNYGSLYGFEFIGSTVTGNDVQNNIGSGHQRCIGFFTSSTGTYDYNDCYNSSIANYVSGTDGGHNLTGDPKFVISPPTTSNDFKLQTSSPAIDAGANLGATYQMTNNSDDTVFPYSLVNQNSFGPGWEMGAFHYAGAVGPNAQVAPSSNSFGTQSANTTSSAFAFTLTNTGDVTLSISSEAIGGTDSSQFAISAQTCGATLAIGATCTVSVTFTPTSGGAKSGTLTFNDNAPSGSQIVTLTGTGVAPNTVYLAPAAAGANDGTSCVDAKAASYFNSSGNWNASPTGIQIGPDTTVHLCAGQYTGTAGQTLLTAQGSGTSGHPVILLFDSFARIVNSAYWGGASAGAITLSAKSYITVDLGTNGLISNLDNGSGLGNQAVSSGIYLSNCQHCTVQASGGSIMSMYRHTQDWDQSANALLTAAVKIAASSNVTVNGLLVTDAGNGILESWANGDANVSLTNNTFIYCFNSIKATGAGTLTNLVIDHNDISEQSNWTYWTFDGTPTTTYFGSGLHLAATGASQVLASPLITRNYFHGRRGDHAGPRPYNNGLQTTTADIWLEQSGSGSITNPLIANNRMLAFDRVNRLFFRPDSYMRLGGTSAQIDNNVVLGTTSGAAECLRFGPGSGNFQNNICDRVKTGVNILAGATLTSNNNALSNLTNMINGATTYASVGAWTAATSKDSASTTTAALTSSLGTDLSLQTLKAGSSAINLGADLTSLGITALNTDYSGVARPSGAAWDAGAYEFSAASTDYWVAPIAAQTVVTQGYDAYQTFLVYYGSTTGWVYFMNTTGSSTAMAVTGLPTGLSANIACTNGTHLVAACAGTSNPFYQYNANSNGLQIGVRIQASGSLAPGDYVVPMQVRSNSILHTINIPVRVVATPSLPSPGTYSPGDLPSRTTWEAEMLSDGNKWCNADGSTNPAVQAYGAEGFIWYYDGARVFYQVGDYRPSEPKWPLCALNLANQYADHLNVAGEGHGWRVFTKGLRMAYERTGQQKFKDAIIRATTVTPVALDGGGNESSGIRETSYILSAYVDAELVGVAHNPLAERAVSYLLAQYDQNLARHSYVVANQVSDHQPFWDGLSTTALIEYYDNINPDPRIPVAIKQMLDWWWNAGWNQTSHQFPYGVTGYVPESGNDYGGPTTLTTNLQVPAFAWYYKVTKNADPTYKTEGDNIWSHALDINPSNDGKQYSQNWKWSFDYLTWRAATDPATGILSTPSLSFPNTTVGVTASSQSFTVTNTGNTTLNISSVVKAGADFTKSADNCGATLATGAFCTISVTFTPGSYGSKTGSITITDDAASSPQVVSLSGLGTIITLSPLTLTFATLTLNVASAAQVVTFTNHSGSTINISGITFPVNPDTQYSKSTSCGATLADTASCTISVTFTPTSVGLKLGTLRIADDASGSPRDIPLLGAGAPVNNQGTQLKGAKYKPGYGHVK